MKAYRFARRPGSTGWTRRGFTLLELIVVITIIGILGTMVVWRVTGWVGKAKMTKVKSDCRMIVEAAEHYYLENGKYPQSLEEMKAGKNEKGEEMGTTLGETKDPWGNEYYFELGQDGKPHAWCLGADGMDSGEGENKDYHYPETGEK